MLSWFEHEIIFITKGQIAPKGDVWFAIPSVSYCTVKQKSSTFRKIGVIGLGVQILGIFMVTNHCTLKQDLSPDRIAHLLAYHIRIFNLKTLTFC